MDRYELTIEGESLFAGTAKLTEGPPHGANLSGSDAQQSQDQSYRVIGNDLFATNCAACHGKEGTGGGAPDAELEGVPQRNHRQPDSEPGCGRDPRDGHGPVGT